MKDLCLVVFAAVLLPSVLAGQPSDRLPLPVDPTPRGMTFETAAPTAGILTGLLLPSSGPLTSWAPVWSTLEANGGLKEWGSGPWIGPIPDRWRRFARSGSVVSGFRVLVKTAPGGVQVRQIQVFWSPWAEGALGSAVTEGPVHGSPAEPEASVRIIELRVPGNSVPVGLWGQTLDGAVSQASLVVRRVSTPPAKKSAQETPPSLLAPEPPSVPRLTEPVVPAPALK